CLRFAPFGRSGYEKPQSGYALCAVFLRHILARRNATHCFMGGPKRRKHSPSDDIVYPLLGFITLFYYRIRN
ncbi:MAG: hypothetical protein LBU19_01535, partial [Treponema sp.]|nr:hypothetical protein [Treponema sp.]